MILHSYLVKQLDLNWSLTLLIPSPPYEATIHPNISTWVVNREIKQANKPKPSTCLNPPFYFRSSTLSYDSILNAPLNTRIKTHTTLNTIHHRYPLMATTPKRGRKANLSPKKYATRRAIKTNTNVQGHHNYGTSCYQAWTSIGWLQWSIRPGEKPSNPN